MQYVLKKDIELKEVAGEWVLLNLSKGKEACPPNVIMLNKEGADIISLFTDGCDAQKVISASDNPEATEEFIKNIISLGYLEEDVL